MGLEKVSALFDKSPDSGISNLKKYLQKKYHLKVAFSVASVALKSARVAMEVGEDVVSLLIEKFILPSARGVQA